MQRFRFSLQPNISTAINLRPHHKPMAHDRSKEFHWRLNRPVAAKMTQLQNPLQRFLKTTKGNFSGEDI